MTHTHTARNKTTLAEFLVRKFSDTEIFFTNRKNFIFKWDFLHHSRMENRIKHASPPQNKKQVGCKRDFLVYPSERETDTSVSPPQKGGGETWDADVISLFISQKEKLTQMYPKRKKGGGKTWDADVISLSTPRTLGVLVSLYPPPHVRHTQIQSHTTRIIVMPAQMCVCLCVCVWVCVCG